MRLTARQRNRQREKTPRIMISQEEITADLIYPARRPASEAGAALGRKVR